MSAPWVISQAGTLRSADDWSATLLLLPNTAGNLIFGTAGRLVRPYQRPKIAIFGQAWDAAGNGLISYGLTVNGRLQGPYENNTAALASPFDDTSYLPIPLDIPQGATLNVVVSLGAAAQNVNFTARLVVYYFDQDPDLVSSLFRGMGLRGLKGDHHLPGGSPAPQGVAFPAKLK